MVTAERLFEAMRQTEWHRSQIQGFKYGNRLVIRDCTLPGPEQEVWSDEADEGRYEAAHEIMMNEIEIRRYQVALIWIDDERYDAGEDQ